MVNSKEFIRDFFKGSGYSNQEDIENLMEAYAAVQQSPNKENIAIRLKYMYISRTRSEKKLISLLRRGEWGDSVCETINYLREMCGRIQELERLCDVKTVNEIKSELNIE